MSSAGGKDGRGSPSSGEDDQGSEGDPAVGAAPARERFEFDPDAALAEARAREAMEVLRDRERGARGAGPRLAASASARPSERPGPSPSEAFPSAEWASRAPAPEDPLPHPDPADEATRPSSSDEAPRQGAPTDSALDTEPPPDDAYEAGFVDLPDADPEAPEYETPEDPRIPPGESFRIGEVARIVGVKPYVLRYWETEFPCVEPEKTSTNQRRYRREDVARLLQIRRLRHDAHLTVAQTRAFVEEASRTGERVPAWSPDALAGLSAPADAPLAREDARRLRGRLADMRQAVLELLEAVDE
jgi:DNA-binding transcriptional MerR regulator